MAAESGRENEPGIAADSDLDDPTRIIMDMTTEAGNTVVTYAVR